MLCAYYLNAKQHRNQKTHPFTFYDRTSTRKAPAVLFDVDRLYIYYSTVAYLIGQVRGIHEKNNFLTPAAGIFNYKGEKWSDDNRALFALYYLGRATSTFPAFIDGEESAITPSLENYYIAHLKPTFAPSDPNFKLEDARNALEELGVKL